MKRICLVIDSAANSGGTDRVVVNLANLFIKNNNDVSLICLDGKSPYYPLSDEVKNIKINSSHRIGKLLEAVKNIKEISFDSVIIVSMGKLSAQILPLLKLYKVKSKVLCSDHVSIMSFKVYIRLIKYFSYLFADYLIVLTDNDAGILKRIYNYEKIKVIRNYSSFSSVKYTNDNLLDKGNLFISIGRLTFQKNQKRLLSIWSKHSFSDWELLLVGNGEDKELLLDYIKKNNIKNVSIIEPTKNINEIYSKASVFLLTSRYEGLPMVLIEAKNFAVPVISFNCETGPKEIINGDGYLIDYHDDEKFLEKMIKITDKKNRLPLAIKALDNSKDYSEDKIYQDWLNVLK